MRRERAGSPWWRLSYCPRPLDPHRSERALTSHRLDCAKWTHHLPAAERMRMYRKRRRNGLHCVQVLLHETEIDGLVNKGHLRGERRGNREAIEFALGIFVCHELGLPPQDET